MYGGIAGWVVNGGKCGLLFYRHTPGILRGLAWRYLFRNAVELCVLLIVVALVVCDEGGLGHRWSYTRTCLILLFRFLKSPPLPGCVGRACRWVVSGPGSLDIPCFVVVLVAAWPVGFAIATAPTEFLSRGKARLS